MKKTLIFFLLIFFGIFGYGQAVIDEANITQILHVDNESANASDNNAGTDINMPLETIQEALIKAKDIPSKIIVYPGTYRNYLDILSNSLLILEASESGEVFISGSEEFDNWQADGAIYTHAWDYDWGYYDDSDKCFGPCMLSDYQRRREMLFIDSVPVKQVVDLNDLRENTFFVDEENDKILLNPPENIDLSSVKVEVTTKGFDLYNQGRNGSLIKASVYQNSGLIIRGFTIQHVANTMHQDALTIMNTNNLIVEDCIFQWNNGVGMELINCDNVTVNNCIARYNGERGMGVGGGEDIRFSNIDLYENNWRMNSAKVIAHDAAGIKLYGGIENCILDNIHAYNNYCHTIWFDWNNGNYTIKNSLIENNQESGIMLEASRKSASVENCKLLYNGVGIKGYGHANVSVDGCFLFANGAQISLGQDGRTVMQDDNWEINCKDWDINNSKIISATPTQGMISFFGFLSPSTNASANYFNTAEADFNVYFHPKDDQRWPDGTSVNGGQLTFDEWRNITGQDANSIWEKPSPEDVGGNEPPVAILEYEFFNDTIVRFFADKSYDPEGFINSYKWYFGDGETSDKRNVNHYYSDLSENVEVSLVVTDFFNVKDSVSTSFFVGTNAISAPYSYPFHFTVYPNPGKELICIEVSSDKKISPKKILVSNNAGQIVIEKGFSNIINQSSWVNISELKPGVYFVTLILENGNKSVQKLIKE